MWITQNRISGNGDDGAQIHALRLLTPTAERARLEAAEKAKLEEIERLAAEKARREAEATARQEAAAAATAEAAAAAAEAAAAGVVLEERLVVDVIPGSCTREVRAAPFQRVLRRATHQRPALPCRSSPSGARSPWAGAAISPPPTGAAPSPPATAWRRRACATRTCRRAW
jgi:hypothetical protein